MIDRDDAWIWDFWVVDDASSTRAGDPAAYHCFFLHAPRSLGDPDLRHTHARIGHAVSSDLIHWEHLDDAVLPGEVPAFDDVATWTGSVVRGEDGLWRMFYTGIARPHGDAVQRIGLATSTDLRTWRRDPDWELRADPRWYDVHSGPDGREDWRDPWIARDAGGCWHMYVTAGAGGGRGRGVVGHAVSQDLVSWEVRPPLSVPTGRFTWLEVLSITEVEGRWVLLFSCLGDEMPHDGPGAGGVWSVPVDGPGAPVDIGRAVRVTSEDLYVGKLVTLRDGGHRFLAFVNRGPDGGFAGGVTHPIEVRWNAAGTGLELIGVPDPWQPTRRRRSSKSR